MVMKTELYTKSDLELVQELGKRFREYRLRYDKTQQEIADFTGLSLFTIGTFEKGTGTGISMVNFLKLLRAINALEDVENILPPLPESPRLRYEQQQKRKLKASRHGK